MMNNVKNKRLIWTVLFMWLYFLTPIRAASEDSVDVQEIVQAVLVTKPGMEFLAPITGNVDEEKAFYVVLFVTLFLID